MRHNRIRRLGVAAATLLGLLALPVTAHAATPKCPSTSCRALGTGFANAYAVTLDGHGSAYLSYWGGQLDRVDVTTGKRSTLATGLGNLRGVATDGAGAVYVAEFGGTVLEVDADGSRRPIAAGLGDGLLGVAYGNGHLYAGSESGQVWEIGATPRLVTANAGMVADLTVGRDGLYVAAFSGTISRIDPATGIVRVLTSDRYDPNAVQVSANGLVYFATGGVLQSVDPATGSVSSDLHVGADDDVWDFSLGATSVVLERDTLWAVTGL